MTPNEIAVLISRIAVGDTEAENDLFQFLDPLVRKMVFSRLYKKMAWAEQMDIFADTLNGLLISLRKNAYDPKKQELGKYIGGIIDNKIKQFYCKKSSNREFPDDYEQTAGIESPERSALLTILSDELFEFLQKKISVQKTSHRKILELTFIEGMSVHEISTTLGMPPKKVTDLKHYALKKLVNECQNDNYFSIFNMLMQILL